MRYRRAAASSQPSVHTTCPNCQNNPCGGGVPTLCSLSVDKETTLDPCEDEGFCDHFGHCMPGASTGGCLICDNRQVSATGCEEVEGLCETQTEFCSHFSDLRFGSSPTSGVAMRSGPPRTIWCA